MWSAMKRHDQGMTVLVLAVTALTALSSIGNGTMAQQLVSGPLDARLHG